MPENKPNLPLFTKEYRTINQIKGPLLFINHIDSVSFNEMIEILDPSGQTRIGRVLEADGHSCLVQVFTGTDGLDLKRTAIRFTGQTKHLNVSLSMLGRILNGSGEPRDGGAPIQPETSLDINGAPINPVERVKPSEFIQTGISALDGLNSLARGQKLPIFSAAGLPGNEIAVQIASQAKVTGMSESFAVVFGGIGITQREAAFFINRFRSSGALDHSVIFLNQANDPTIERILTPRVVLTTAEYLAFTHGYHVLVILTDMTNYCEALREVAAAREEIPGRRGYPGYMYSDLASIFERAGKIRGRPGTITQVPILSMPDDDITHPIPDLTGYITEGQIVLNRDLHFKGIYPPVDVLPSLSRLMDAAIGPEKTREDHPAVRDQLYALYDEGINLRQLIAVIGESALSENDRLVLQFADEFEKCFIHQGNQERSIEKTLETAWQLFSGLPQEMLKKIKPEYLQKYYSGRP